MSKETCCDESKAVCKGEESIELTDADMEKVSGGFNPQPDPPGSISRVLNVAAPLINTTQTFHKS